MTRYIFRSQRHRWSTAKTVGVATLVLVVGAGVVFAGGWGALPSLQGRTETKALADSDGTRLGRTLAPRIAANRGRSGIHALADSLDAFAARVLLARAAERTLDVQYYIWHEDLSGTLLFEGLRSAADRGVRVRLLLDDHNTVGLDPTLAALDAHPNIEVRLFNPFVIRQPRLFGYLTDFFRVNRRMHNKSFTADNQATIVGGRNVGDEYFGAADGTIFVDLDVLAVGPVVNDVSADFDRYWASDSSYPLDLIVPAVTPAEVRNLDAAAERIRQDPAARAYLEALRRTAFATDLVAGKLPLEWAPTRMVSDDPAKGLGLAGPEGSLVHDLAAIIGEPRERVDLISAYFVPTEAGVEAFTAHVRRGVAVNILTNSLEATDVAVVHAGYAKRRKALLAGGVSLYELRWLPDLSDQSNGLDGSRGSNGSEGRRHSILSGGSSGSSLHAKTFSVDGERVFVGSFNFDPRSKDLNTELGFVIDSPPLAQRIRSEVERGIPGNAYRVKVSEDGDLYWEEERGGEVIRHEVEPGTSVWLRAGVWLMSLLPIDWML